MEDDSKLRPFMATPPGAILRREIKARGWTQTEFAEIIGRSVQNVNELIQGKRQITTETAMLFEAALEIAAEFWLRLEMDYRLQTAHLNTIEIEHVRERAKRAS